jgi:hypothetical protein
LLVKEKAAIFFLKKLIGKRKPLFHVCKIRAVNNISRYAVENK